MKDVRADAADLSALITQDPAWDWALNDKNQGILDKAAQSLSSSLTVFHRTWLNDDPKQVQKRFEPEIVLSELKSFNLLRKKSDALKVITTQFRGRHAAGIKPKTGET